ncbi:hypothetical protein N1851_030998 [Merluccius polli]|uniref:Uncharacterized protein n=1 Tax=Merluccius polli TaxID=89951 RepID=A0AA47M4P7_MERPO|nr:hypothetical protein N1851_030998 [Merluccius polli]
MGIMADMVRRQISAEIKEAGHFAIMVDEIERLDAESLLKSIEHTLAQCVIDKNACIGQCYDGAAVMSWCNNGVQERFRKVGEFFETVQLLYNLFSNSVAHNHFMKKQRELESTAQPVLPDEIDSFQPNHILEPAQSNNGRNSGSSKGSWSSGS